MRAEVTRMVSGWKLPEPRLRDQVRLHGHRERVPRGGPASAGLPERRAQGRAAASLEGQVAMLRPLCWTSLSPGVTSWPTGPVAAGSGPPSPTRPRSPGARGSLAVASSEFGLLGDTGWPLGGCSRRTGPASPSWWLGGCGRAGASSARSWVARPRARPTAGGGAPGPPLVSPSLPSSRRRPPRHSGRDQSPPCCQGQGVRAVNKGARKTVSLFLTPAFQPVCAKPRTADLEGKGRLGGRGASWSSLCAPRRLLRLEKRLNNKRYRIRNK